MEIVKPNTNYPFIPKRKPFLIMSSVLVVLGLIVPFVLSPNWGTSFSGGSSIILHFEDEVAVEDLRSAFASEEGFSDIAVQNYGPEGKNGFILKTRNTAAIPCSDMDTLEDGLSPGLATRGAANAEVKRFPKCEAEGISGDFFLRFEETVEVEAGAEVPDTLDPKSGVSVAALQEIVDESGIAATVSYEKNNRRFIVKPAGLQADVTRILLDNFGEKFDAETGLDEIVTVGPDVGEKFRNDGILSILFALGLILLYIAIRFDVRYAPGAVVALAHDVIITFGLLTLFGVEVTLETVAALLAIVGYSLNDTIVTFDRIRENLQGGEEGPLDQTVNKSINECLSRTLLTSLTTLFAVIVLSVAGTGVIQDFAITLTIGVAIGTYSSIFVASPVMLWMDGWLQRRRERDAARRRLDERAAEATAET